MTPSENGWQPARLDPGSNLLRWAKVPGVNVSLQVRAGRIGDVMLAVAADFNAYIEPLRDADSACYTPTNSVDTSNHLNATAMDLRWDRHPFQVRGTFNTAQMVTIRELLDFFEGWIFWAGDWDSPADEMHWQAGYNTYGRDADLEDFCRRKIRPDGFSTFRRVLAPAPVAAPAPPPPILSRADRYALAIMAVCRRLGISERGSKITLSVGLVETNLTMYANSNEPASLNLPHDAVGSDHLSSGIYQQQPPWGPLADRMDVTRSTTIFLTVDNGPGVRGLTKIRDPQGNVYDYNDTANSPGFYAQKVQGSAFPDRYDERYAEAAALYDKLAPLLTGEDDMFTDADRNLLQQISDIRRPSRSPLHWPDQGDVDTCAGFAWASDGNIHVILVEKLAVQYGDVTSIALLWAVANKPDATNDPKLATAILNAVPKNFVDAARTAIQAWLDAEKAAGY